jgi:outer membrane lipoprotein-sorting protein
MKLRATSLLFALFCLLSLGSLQAVARDEDRILSVAQNMDEAFKRLEDYTCDVEQIFYPDGENQRYLFKFYFKKNKKIRVDFFDPHPGLTITYIDDDKAATVFPIRSLPVFRVRLSVDNPLLKTLSGQRINQTDMGYFIDFILKNVKKVEQKGNDFYEDAQRVEFLVLALDYISERSLEKYRISISKEHWLPTRIERYSLEGKLLEVTNIKDYLLNTNLKDKFFLP